MVAILSQPITIFIQGNLIWKYYPQNGGHFNEILIKTLHFLLKKI